MIDLFPNSTFFVQLAVFLAAVWVFNRGILKPVLLVLDARKEKSSGVLDETEVLEKSLADTLSRYEQTLQEAKTQAFQAKDEIVKMAREKEKQIVELARRENEARLSVLRSEIERETRDAQTLLSKQVPSIAALLAARVLRSIPVITALGAGSFALPALGFASETEAHGGGIPVSVLFHAINLLILIAILVAVLRQPVKDFFGNRQLLISQAVNAAQERRRDFAKRSREMEAKFSRLDQDIAALKHAILEGAALEKKDILDRAELFVAKSKDDVTRFAEQELKKAKAFLKQHVLALAFQNAEAELCQTFGNPEAERRFESKTLHDLEHTL